MDHPRLSRPLAPVTMLAVLTLAAAACTNDNNTGVTPGPQFVGSFVGYSNPDTKQTTCGNCHVGKQTTWLKTGHAKAWSDMMASGHGSGTACGQCHTVNGKTNIGADSGGFFGASEAAQPYFYDVQCESCHGPGQGHVTVPDSTQPIPYFTSFDSTVTGGPVGCGTCHSGSHNPFIEDWSKGVHNYLWAPAINNTTPGTATTLACRQCHEGREAAARWESSKVYVEATSTTSYPIGCTTCHDPHGSSNSHELYQSISVRDSTNLCIQCHKRRSVPDVTSTRGPHTPQGPTFLGYSGWQPAGFTWDWKANVSTHSDPTANPDLCATCHMERFSIGSGASYLGYTGHKFWAIPCTTATGQVDTTNTCSDDARRFTACTASGCHASEAAVRTLLESTAADLQFIADLIWKDSNANGKVDTTDAGLLARVPQTEFKTRTSTTTTPYTTAEGARFNVQMLTTDGSSGAHNPAYLRSLLVATYTAVKTQYALPVAPAMQARVDAIQAR